MTACIDNVVFPEVYICYLLIVKIKFKIVRWILSVSFHLLEVTGSC